MPSLAHKDDEYETPDWLFEDAEKETGLKFKIDVACTEDNKKCVNGFYDSLNCEWILPKIGNIKHQFVPVFCNAPRSINGKFVDKTYEQWLTYNIDIVTLLCWNDLGNKYGEKLLPRIINSDIRVKNLGKIKFYKNGIESEFPSRLTYFRAWFKKK